MKTSITNILISPTIDAVSAVACVTGKEGDNILDDNIRRVYAVSGNLDVSVYNIGYLTSVDFIALFNVYFDSQLILELYDLSDVLLATYIFDTTDMIGFQIKNLYVNVPATIIGIDRIRAYTTGSGGVTKWIGYIWAGDYTDFDCLEKALPVSMSNDNVQVSRTNHPETNVSYKYRTFTVTLRKEHDFKVLRELIESIQLDGYGKGRPWLFDEVPFSGEMYFCIMDSGKVQHDLFDFQTVSGGTEYSSQSVFGLREVT